MWPPCDKGELGVCADRGLEEAIFETDLSSAGKHKGESSPN